MVHCLRRVTSYGSRFAPDSAIPSHCRAASERSDSPPALCRADKPMVHCLRRVTPYGSRVVPDPYGVQQARRRPGSRLSSSRLRDGQRHQSQPIRPLGEQWRPPAAVPASQGLGATAFNSAGALTQSTVLFFKVLKNNQFFLGTGIANSLLTDCLMAARQARENNEAQRPTFPEC